ncbi:MAG: hypothetical protein MZW92_16835, partial [Comamonadaceae bacterium]|nr:hypothetical protein [Comamonadaceae bacterium]
AIAKVNTKTPTTFFSTCASLHSGAAAAPMKRGPLDGDTTITASTPPQPSVGGGETAHAAGGAA